MEEKKPKRREENERRQAPPSVGEPTAAAEGPSLSGEAGGENLWAGEKLQVTRTFFLE